jgi:PAS domain-containing protein
MNFQGQIPNRQKEFYTTFLIPIVFLKKAVESVRRYIAKTIWSELVQGEKIDNEILNLILFAVFCLLSLITFRLERYQTAIIIGSAILWRLDQFLAKQQYFASKKRTVLWKMVAPNAEPRQFKFHRNNINHIKISLVQVNGGAFEEPIARAWQVAIALKDETQLLIYEELRAINALNHARELASCFDIPILFTDSEGQTHYADRAFEQALDSPKGLTRKATQNNAIRLNQTAQRWHIFSHWTLNHSWKFFGKVFYDSGFLIFVLLLARFMSRFGEMLDTLITYYRENQIVYLDFSGIINFFLNPHLSAIDLAGIAIATAVMIIRGAQISQIKHVYIDKQRLRYAINAKEIRQFNLPEIEVVVLIAKPSPVLLICDRDRALEVKDLLLEDDYRAMLVNIENGLDHYLIY